MAGKPTLGLLSELMVLINNTIMQYMTYIEQNHGQYWWWQ